MKVDTILRLCVRAGCSGCNPVCWISDASYSTFSCEEVISAIVGCNTNYVFWSAKTWYKNRISFREISSADWVCPCCIRHSFMSKLYKEDKVITHNVLLFPTFFFQKTSDKFTNLSSIISKEREVVLGCRGWWVRCIQDAGVRLMMQTPAGVRCLLLGSHCSHPHIHHSGSGLDWTGLKEYLNIEYQDTFHSWSTYYNNCIGSGYLNCFRFWYFWTIGKQNALISWFLLKMTQNGLKCAMQFKHNFKVFVKVSTKLKQKKICKYSTINAVR